MPNNGGMDTISPIEKAADEVGGLTKLARMLGVSPPTVHEWKTKRRPVPASQCKSIVGLANGKVTLQELRPTDWQKYWPELAEAQTNTACAAIESAAQGA